MNEKKIPREIDIAHIQDDSNKDKDHDNSAEENPEDHDNDNDRSLFEWIFISFLFLEYFIIK